MAEQAPDYDDALQAFLHWVVGVEAYEVIDPAARSMRPFVVADVMRNYFEENDHRKLKRIISAHFSAEAANLWPDDIVPHNVAVFCTLLSISKGRWMNQFCHHSDLSDSALPFDPLRPPPNWPHGADFLPEFCEKQWKFCAPVFRVPFIGRRFPDNMVLPIVWKENLNREGSSASLWKIKIHPSYNRLISEAEKERLGDLKDTFVMKTYFTSEAERYYNTEVAAFRHLGLNPSIIKFHGSFIRGDSYNVLLEYADKGTLAEYFKNEPPPSEGEDIIQFWEAMFKIIDALRRIHEVGWTDKDGPRVFQGRHQDVKPENVLVVSNGSDNRGDWIFKLADLGISKFKVRNGRQDSIDRNTRGTRTYGAPESYRPDGTYVHDTLREGQNSDIWSLGCIFSEAARWLKDGHRGIESYRQERQGETSKLQGFRDGDCFHDGEKMLSCVRQCNKNSVRNLRPEDFITKSVCDVLIQDMLGMAEARSTAYKLYQRSRQLVTDAEEELALSKAEPEPSRLPKFTGRPRNRSFTVPNYEARPPPPPNPPPGPFPAIHLNAIPQNKDAFSHYVTPSQDVPPPHILSPTHTTSEPEGLENPRFSPTSPPVSPSRPAVVMDDPEDRNAFPNSTIALGKRPESGPNWGQYSIDTAQSSQSLQESSILSPDSVEFQHSPPSTAISQHETPSPPSLLPAFSTTSSPFNPRMSSANETTQAHRTVSVRRTPVDNTRPAPVIIQGHPPRLPYLALADALEWRRKRKSSGQKKPLKDWDYLAKLKDPGRDHVFLIDDAASMEQHWTNVQQVFETLSYMVKEVDPDGFDLWFTGHSKPMKNCRHTTEPLHAVEHRSLRGTTDITVKLSTIFDDYIDALHKQKTGKFKVPFSKPAKPLSLYVLTDGVWQANCDPTDLFQNFVKQLQDLNKVKGKVGIQFISFGHDPTGLRRMDLLDSGLEVKLDIVDTEPWDGNVWKMLLGAINDTFDKMHDKYNSQENGATSSSNRASVMSDHGKGVGYI